MRVKNPVGSRVISIWLLVGFHSASRSVLVNKLQSKSLTVRARHIRPKKCVFTN